MYIETNIYIESEREKKRNKYSIYQAAIQAGEKLIKCEHLEMTALIKNVSIKGDNLLAISVFTALQWNVNFIPPFKWQIFYSYKYSLLFGVF